MDIPGEPAPSLHPHPSEQELHRSYEPVRQRAPPRYSVPPVSAVGRLPLAPQGLATPVAVSTLAFSRSCKSRRPGSRRLNADTTWPGTRAPARLIPGMSRDPGFDAIYMGFRRLNSARPAGPSGRTLLERLPGPHLTRSTPRLFPGRSPRRSSANAAPGRFDARPRRADAGGPAILHLSHSTAYEESTYMEPPSAFVTHLDSPFLTCATGASPDNTKSSKVNDAIETWVLLHTIPNPPAARSALPPRPSGRSSAGIHAVGRPPLTATLRPAEAGLDNEALTHRGEKRPTARLDPAREAPWATIIACPCPRRGASRTTVSIRREASASRPSSARIRSPSSVA
jgi:hypothetical protein